MDALSPLPQQEIRSLATPRAHSGRYLYVGVSALLFALTLLGFQQFYLHGNDPRGGELVASVRTLLIAHGSVMTLWILLFFIQPLLIVNRQRRLHISLGVFGVGLAAAVVILGPWSAVATARAIPDAVHAGGLDNRSFLAIPFGSILNFSAFVAIGLWQRRRPEIHRPMMLLGTLAIMGAATQRIGWLRELYVHTIWIRIFGPYLIPLVIGGAFFAAKTVLTRSWDRWLAGGYCALVLVDASILAVAHSATWAEIAGRLVP